MISVNQKINLPDSDCSLYIKREDLLHPYISGNKWRKLKYNLETFLSSGCDTIVTFGGAFSNHIAATAFACQEKGISVVGIIRGEELVTQTTQNPTLRFAQACGMKFEFVSRELYRKKESKEFQDYLKTKYGQIFYLPEGGTNEDAVKGCEEILTTEDKEFDYICCAVGTGGTISGIINASEDHQKIIGFPALKGEFLTSEICKFAKKTNWRLAHDYHFGGYGKVTSELIRFLNDFYIQNNIPLDPVYTGKMMFGVLELMKTDFFPKGSKILTIHTGGLQGILGMNQLLEKKQMEKIEF